MDKLYINKKNLGLPFFLVSALFAIEAKANWFVSSGINQDLGYSDNVTMSVHPVASMFYVITPKMTLMRQTDSSDIKANISYGTQHYESIDRFNQDIQAYDLSALYRVKAWQWGLAGSLDSNPIRSSAVMDTGNFASNALKETKSIQPSLTYFLDEKNTLKLSPSYSEISYTTQQFSNSDDRSINLNWQKRWSAAYNTSLTADYSDYQFQSNTNGGSKGIYDNYSINLANNYQILEQLSVNAALGIRFIDYSTELSDTDYNPIIDKGLSVGYLGNVGLIYEKNYHTFQISANRSISPSGQGQLRQLDGVTAKWDSELLEHLSTHLLVNYSQSNSTINHQANNNFDILTLNPSVRWRFAKEWYLTGSYQYRTKNSDGINPVTDSNMIMLSVNYNWQGYKF